MIKLLVMWILIVLPTFALEVPELVLSESLQEQKQGNEFLQIIWDTSSVVADIETQVYLKKLGQELSIYSENPSKHLDFFMLNDDSINAFSGPYGYIGVHTGMLLSSDSESELAGVLSHEISHVTQSHLTRFSEKTGKQTYIMLASMLAAVLANNSTIAVSGVAAIAQQSINFTRAHEWEADRIGTKMLLKSGFDPKGMANFFKKLKDNPGVNEFLRTHPLSINRISDSIQRSARERGDYRADSFEYLTIKAKLYYHQHKRIKLETNKVLNLYMYAYDALEKQKYRQAKNHISQLLKLNHDNPTYILAGRIYSKLAQIDKAQAYFSKVNDSETSIYYAAKAYAANNKITKGVGILRRYLKLNVGTYHSHKLLSSLYVSAGKLDRVHMHNAKALVLQGKLSESVTRYQRAKSVTQSRDLFDVLTVKIERLEQLIDLYQNLSN
ncbi:peptidase M48, Ste24p [Isorropodon fossajaponicum endosymbiont JTNG4]|uniref:M48 family metalloprotease n=1 Tax=Isorropodon fossajaponicum symbiont TaxID=883811 RepID=UPI001915B020|nr:M48 family metalloprotease [Isorropodon fossajaponicum symbiont]BBB24459.1 peptidase M48, Ste24p [Isorropodon fossajaponicum endosymbiont JTNG4]